MQTRNVWQRRKKMEKTDMHYSAILMKKTEQ